MRLIQTARRDAGLDGSDRVRITLDPEQPLQIGENATGPQQHRHTAAASLHQGVPNAGVEDAANGTGAVVVESQDFEPRPAPTICSWCDYRLICPASEA